MYDWRRIVVWSNHLNRLWVERNWWRIDRSWWRICGGVFGPLLLTWSGLHGGKFTASVRVMRETVEDSRKGPVVAVVLGTLAVEDEPTRWCIGRLSDEGISDSGRVERGLKWGSGLTTIWVGMPPWDERVGIEDSEGIGARVWRWRRNCEAWRLGRR